MIDVVFLGPGGFEAPIRTVEMYSDSTTRVKIPEFEEIVGEADTLLLTSSVASTVLAAFSICDGVEAHGGRIDNLILPYIPGARQDRSNPTGDVGFMLQTMARLINSYEFDRVLTVDPHSYRSLDRIEAVTEYPLGRVYEKLWKGYNGVIAPDKGAVNRAGLAAHILGKPLVIGSKTRDVATGALSGFEVTVEPGAHYVVVDDICDGGGTFLGLGERIREQGAYADLFVTHGIFSKGLVDLRKVYKNIYTTNTRTNVMNFRDLHVFDVVSDMKEYLQ